ncbi:MAG: flavodoxin domain-containing protein [Candidatus Sabulitectum sp.]|nr:flavodoxin domain-containing protein [Candidatus Sabulitectum sp.]
MKIAVIYSSKTGNTKKVASAILEGVGAQAQLFSVDDEISLDEYDLIFMGFWVDKGSPDKKASEFMSKISWKKVAYFVTLGAYPDSQHAKDSLEKGIALLGEHCEIVDSFICQGAIDPKLMEWMMTLPEDHPHSPDEKRIKRWEDACNRPDSTDLLHAKEFGNNVIRAL